MSSRQYIVDKTIRHRAFLQRYAGTVYKDMTKFLGEITDKTAKAVNNAPTVLSKERQKALLDQIKAINASITKDMNTVIGEQLQELVGYEVDFMQKTIDRALDFQTESPSKNQLLSALRTPLDRINDKINLQNMLKTFNAEQQAQDLKIIRQGYATGDTNETIIKALREGDTMTYRQARSLTLTATNHLANVASKLFYEANSDIITGYQWISTLDDTTCPICGALDQQTFSSEEFEEPPEHWNCRCTFIPVFDKELNQSDLGGTRPAQDEEGAYEQVPTNTTYNSWIKSQPASFQDEILGPGRAQLLRDGADMKTFVDHNYQLFTLDQLAHHDEKH